MGEVTGHTGSRVDKTQRTYHLTTAQSSKTDIFNSEGAGSANLVQECAERESDNPHTLLQAYSVASAMGQDDIAMPLIHKATQLSKGEDAPIKSFSFREMVEFMKDSASDWRSKNDMFRNGSIPILWAAHILNVPLSRLLIAIPRENKNQWMHVDGSPSQSWRVTVIQSICQQQRN